MNMVFTRLYRTGMLRECWDFRGFIVASVKREFVARYLGTQLGLVWAVVQPLAMILIYTLVFATIMKPAIPGHDNRFAYSIYLCAGLLTWQLFSDLLNRSVGIFVQNAGLLKKVNVPKLALPVVAALSCVINFAIVFLLFLAFLAITGNHPGIAIAAMIPVLTIVILLALGLGVLVGTINVFYRDVEQTTSMLLQFWFWLTPIVYPTRALPDLLAGILAWNPLWPIVNFSQTIFLEDRVPEWSSLAYPTLVALAFAALAWVGFRKLSGEIVDEL